jgi:hypothetical protein
MTQSWKASNYQRDEPSIVSSKDETTDVHLNIRKYEGHSPAPWKLRQAWEDHENRWGLISADKRYIAEVMWYPSGHVKDQCKVNAKLIEDAPLLVEEVKRLRNKIRLLDIVEDKDGALDRILLNSGMLTEKELKGAYSDSELVGVEFHN